MFATVMTAGRNLFAVGIPVIHKFEAVEKAYRLSSLTSSVNPVEKDLRKRTSSVMKN